MALNYSELQGIARKEKSSPRLQAVSEGFYADVLSLLGGLKDEYRESAVRLADETYYARVGKILRLASRIGEKSPPGNMTGEEAKIYNRVIEYIAEEREKILALETVLEEAEEKTEEPERPEEDHRAKLRILSPIPAIIGSDLTHYGPFEEGEEVRIPKTTAKILIEQGVAERI